MESLYVGQKNLVNQIIEMFANDDAWELHAAKSKNISLFAKLNWSFFFFFWNKKRSFWCELINLTPRDNNE